MTSSIIDRLSFICQCEWIAYGSSSGLSQISLMMKDFNICKISLSTVCFRTWSQVTAETFFRDFWILKKIFMPILSCRVLSWSGWVSCNHSCGDWFSFEVVELRNVASDVCILWPGTWINWKCPLFRTEYFLCWLYHDESNHQIPNG